MENTAEMARPAQQTLSEQTAKARDGFSLPRTAFDQNMGDYALSPSILGPVVVPTVTLAGF